MKILKDLCACLKNVGSSAAACIKETINDIRNSISDCCPATVSVVSRSDEDSSSEVESKSDNKHQRDQNQPNGNTIRDNKYQRDHQQPNGNPARDNKHQQDQNQPNNNTLRNSIPISNFVQNRDQVLLNVIQPSTTISQTPVQNAAAAPRLVNFSSYAPGDGKAGIDDLNSERERPVSYSRSIFQANNASQPNTQGTTCLQLLQSSNADFILSQGTVNSFHAPVRMRPIDQESELMPNIVTVVPLPNSPIGVSTEILDSGESAEIEMYYQQEKFAHQLTLHQLGIQKHIDAARTAMSRAPNFENEGDEELPEPLPSDSEDYLNAQLPKHSNRTTRVLLSNQAQSASSIRPKSAPVKNNTKDNIPSKHIRTYATA